MLLLACGSSAQRSPQYQRLPVRLDGRVAPADFSYARTLKGAAPGQAAPGAAPATRSGDRVYAVFNLEFESEAACARFQVSGIHVFNRFQRFADVYLPYENDRQAGLLQLGMRSAEGLVRAESGGLISPPPPPRAERVVTRGPAEPEAVARGGARGLTGKGVIVAVIDSGIDFRHPDFIAMDAAGKPISRLLYLWDTSGPEFEAGKAGSKPPLSYPDGAPVGTLYTREQLTAELRSGGKTLPVMDRNGHGTACAGIAAGNGSAAKERYAGVAPGADIIGVRITGPDGDGTENAYLVNAACAWIDRVAGEHPAVISCSFGGHHGGHDGNLVEERQLNARFAPGVKGRALCIAAGNEGIQALHAEATFEGKEKPARFSWKAEEDARLSVFFDTERAEDLVVAGIDGSNPPRFRAEVNPITKQVAIHMPVPAGAGGILIANTSGRQTRCDAYLMNGAFEPDSASFARMVCTPGLTAGAITVGSYDWNDLLEHQGHTVRLINNKKTLVFGTLSGYSNPGPSRNGTLKPDLTAPGQFFIAPLARDAEGKPVKAEALIDTSGQYRAFNGTSAATPYAAGVVALMLEKKTALTVGEIRELLCANLTADQFTGTVPNPRWGRGKLDLKAVERALDAVR